MREPTRINGQIAPQRVCFCGHKYRPIDKHFAGHCPKCHQEATK